MENITLEGLVNTIKSLEDEEFIIEIPLNGGESDAR